jgi:hypothetical protein
VFTTNFGIENQAIARASYTQPLAIDVVKLDTGRLFRRPMSLGLRTSAGIGSVYALSIQIASTPKNWSRARA